MWEQWAALWPQADVDRAGGGDGLRAVAAGWAAHRRARRVGSGGVEEDLADRVIARLRAMPPESGSSVLWDRLAGHELEYDARNGAVVRAGARVGVPTPYNETVTALLEAVSASGKPS
ncbi:ketopantoate reductase family protein [Streptomyces sp. NPDC127084]|uniref:ketopantoate reductase family protein n=1 Tax=Streptomyces sp. NPDC127084 TaxID=3347133 RepID=UPI00364B75EA